MDSLLPPVPSPAEAASVEKHTPAPVARCHRRNAAPVDTSDLSAGLAASALQSQWAPLMPDRERWPHCHLHLRFQLTPPARRPPVARVAPLLKFPMRTSQRLLC